MADQEQQAAATSTAKPKPGRKKGSRAQKAASKKAKAKSTAKRGPGRPKGSKNRFVSKKKGRKSRTRYTPARRAEILAAAKQKGLTAIQVQKRFGVTPVTYYSWRKKAGTSSKRGRPAGAVRIGGGDLSQQLRSEVQARIRDLLPAIVRAEVESYVQSALGGVRWARRRA